MLTRCTKAYSSSGSAV